ncbi:MAG TPA: hypothetical protein DEQ32_13220 [Gammaproteobacteria bacterium]|nr:hypothetical protein [Gammaproteobacteria bacterium]
MSNCPKFKKGDYIKWPISALSFTASEDGIVTPVEWAYSYGLVVEVAEGMGDMTDAIIVHCHTNGDWVVAHVDDEKYGFELVSTHPNE